jgi:hypothetical protein
MAEQINVKVYVSPTSRWGRKMKFWQTYRGTTQIQVKLSKSVKFCPEGSQM